MNNLEFEDYEIVEEIGSGGMAKVYKAIQLKLAREVVVKVLNPSLFKDEAFRLRFAREAKISAKFSHANIVQVIDVGELDDCSYLSMEYVKGGDLADLMDSPIELNQIVRLVNEISSALDYAHSHNIIHRDVKTKNILIRENGSFVLADFGIAKAVEIGTQMTIDGSIVGSPKYMSPEQAQGKTIDHRADFYSFGIVLFEVLTGSLPFDGENMVAVAMKHVNSPIPELPDDLTFLQPFFNKALAKSADDRFTCGRELYSNFVDCLKSAADNTVIYNNVLPEKFDAPSYLSNSLNKVSQIDKFDEKTSISWLWKYIGVVVVFGILTTVLLNYINENKREPEVQKKLTSAYKFLQSNMLAKALLEFKGVLEIDANNVMALESLEQVKAIFIEEVRADIRADMLNSASQKLSSLSRNFGDDPQIRKIKLDLANALSLKKLQEDKVSKIENLEKQLTQAYQSGFLVYPPSNSAAWYLNALIALVPENILYQERLSSIENESITKLNEVIISKDIVKAIELLDGHKEFFGESAAFNEMKFLVEKELQRTAELKRTLEDKKRKKATQISLLAKELSAFESLEKLDDVVGYLKKYESYLSYGGTDALFSVKAKQAFQKAILTLGSDNNLIGKIDGFKDIFSLNRVSKSKELSKSYGDFKQLYQQASEKLQASTSILIQIDKLNISEINSISMLNQAVLEVNKLKQLGIHSDKANQIDQQIMNRAKKLLDSKISERNLVTAKLLIEFLAVKYEQIDLAGNRERIAEIERDKQAQELKRKEEVQFLVSQLKSQILFKNWFNAKNTGAFELLINIIDKTSISKEEKNQLKALFVTSINDEISTLVENKQFDKVTPLISSIVPAMERLSISLSLQSEVQRTLEKARDEFKVFKIQNEHLTTLMNEVKFNIEVKETLKALTSLLTLKNYVKQNSKVVDLMKYNQLENQTYGLLLSELKTKLDMKDSSNTAKLITQSKLIYPNDQQIGLLIKELEKIKEKEIKFVGF